MSRIAARSLRARARLRRIARRVAHRIAQPDALLLALGLVCLAIASVLPAQSASDAPSRSRSSVRGTVMDEHHTPVGGATVALPLLQRSTVTDDSGRFVLRELPPLDLVLEVRRPGYRSDIRRVDLSASRDLALTFTLARATVTVAEVVVTGSATASERRGAHDVVAIGDAQLRASSTGSIGRTLEKVPGVTNMSGGPAAGNPVLRGLSQNRVRIVRDGVPQESFEASPRWFPPGNLSSVDRIEVVRGPASILYGSNAMGGAINIVPRALPATSGGGTRILGLAETQYFSNNNERYGHGEIAAAHGAMGVRVGGARRVADNFHTPDVAPYDVSRVQGAPKYAGEVPFSNYEQLSSYAQVGIAQRWGHVRAIYDGWEGHNNFPNASGRPAGVSSRNDDVRVQGNVVIGRLIVRPSVVVQRVGIHRAATAARTFEVAADSNLWDQHLTNRVTTSRIEVGHPAIGGFRGTVGAEYVDQRAVTRLSQVQPSGTVRNAAVFLFEEYRGQRLSLSAGARGDLRQQRAASNTLVDALPAARRPAALARDFNIFTGSFGAAYQVATALSGSVNVSSGFRAPSFLDLYTNEYRPALGGWVEGNPNAKPERSVSIESGVHYATSRISGGLVVYRNALSAFTYLDRSARTAVVRGVSVPVFVTSQTNARLSGIELNATAALLPRIIVDGSYAKIVSRNHSTGEALPLMPADQLRSSVRLAPHTLGRIDVPYVQIGLKHAWYKAIAGPTEPFADGGTQGFGVASTPAYTLLDVGAGGRFAIGASAIEVHLTIDNLLGAAYRDFLDTQKGFTLGMGRNIGVRVAAPLVFVR